MKLNTQAFPYPVLTNLDGPGADYKDSAFQCSLQFSDTVKDDQTFELNYLFMLSNEAISSLIENEFASYAIEINCPDTLKREIKFLEASGGISINANELYGRVDFTPMVIIRKASSNFTSSDLNDEYDNASFNLNFGDIIAVDDTWTKYIEFNNLSFDSLIRVDTSKELDPLDYKIEPTPSIIWIYMGVEMREIWNELKQDKNLKPAIAMSIYKDVIYLALEVMVSDEDSDANRWARSLRAAIEGMGFSIPVERDFNQINILAQKLVQQIGIKKFTKPKGA